jgi:formate hydrogenlyase transcriptional activator
MANELTSQNELGLFSSKSMLDILELIFAAAALREALTVTARSVEARRKGMLCTIRLHDNDGSQLEGATAPHIMRNS